MTSQPVQAGFTPERRWMRGGVYGLILWLLSALYFELLGPYNLLLEPLPLVGVELAVAMPGGILGGIVLSAIYGKIGHGSESAA